MNDINKTWKEIYEYLGKNTETKPLKDDDFLSMHTNMRMKPQDNAALWGPAHMHRVEYSMEKHRRGEFKKPGAKDKIEKYLKRLRDSIKQYYEMHFQKEAKKFPKEYKWWNSIKALGEKGGRSSLMLAVWVWVERKGGPNFGERSKKRTEYLKVMGRFIFLRKNCGRSSFLVKKLLEEAHDLCRRPDTRDVHETTSFVRTAGSEKFKEYRGRFVENLGIIYVLPQSSILHLGPLSFLFWGCIYIAC